MAKRVEAAKVALVHRLQLLIMAPTAAAGLDQRYDLDALCQAAAEMPEAKRLGPALVMETTRHWFRHSLPYHAKNPGDRPQYRSIHHGDLEVKEADEDDDDDDDMAMDLDEDVDIYPMYSAQWQKRRARDQDREQARVLPSGDWELCANCNHTLGIAVRVLPPGPPPP